ncbi:hypothetical protein [Nonomuraea sp. NPDC049784]|uniref:hypothetical protein n=1 Tax=Nonomuraea sp. NPDC049784 TaxID=3154361 RepID=UPI0033C70800
MKTGPTGQISARPERPPFVGDLLAQQLLAELDQLAAELAQLWVGNADPAETPSS